MAELTLPTDERTVRGLRVGQQLELRGRLITGRDAAHAWLLEEHRKEAAPYLAGTMIYHCGPVVGRREDGGWEFLAAGPTTSIREEPYQAAVLEQYGLRGVIGKGGMGPRTSDGLVRCGAVYLHAIGGAAQVLARAVRRVVKVLELEELGVPEALWVVEVEDFPVVVTMDSHGDSLHESVAEDSKRRFDRLVPIA